MFMVQEAFLPVQLPWDSAKASQSVCASIDSALACPIVVPSMDGPNAFCLRFSEGCHADAGVDTVFAGRGGPELHGSVVMLLKRIHNAKEITHLMLSFYAPQLCKDEDVNLSLQTTPSDSLLIETCAPWTLTHLLSPQRRASA
jgi:hypothetical protein